MSIEIIISALPQALSPTVSPCLLAQLSLESILRYPQTIKPPEDVSGGEKIIAIGSLCCPAIDVATVPAVPPLHGDATKRGRLAAKS